MKTRIDPDLGQIVEGIINVGFKDVACEKEIKDYLAKHTLGYERHFPGMAFDSPSAAVRELARQYKLHVAPGNEKYIIDEFKKQPIVEYAEPEMPLYACGGGCANCKCKN